MYDLIIIGSGPAGISASLYASRANLKVLIISKNQGNLTKTEEIENYYGIDLISGPELLQRGIEQAKRLNVEMIYDEVVGIEYLTNYICKTTTSSYESKAVIIATGNVRQSPNIKGLKEKEGMGVSYCAVCDGFFYRKKDVVVIGNGEYAYHEALELKNIGVNVIICTNGLQPEFKEKDIEVNTGKIMEIKGTDKVESILIDDKQIDISGVFVAVGIAGSFDFARKLGALVEGTRIVVNQNMETNIPGLYAAGDTTGGLLQISKAVYEGAKASTEVIKYIRKNKA